MRRYIVLIATLCCALLTIAQDTPAASKASKLCVGQLRNQTSTKFEIPKLRQSFLDSLQATNLVKSGAIVLIPIDADNSDDAKADVQKQGCDFALYTRILRKPPVENRTYETGTTIEVYKHEQVSVETYGLQCTLERTSSGMPLLIDRRFDSAPSKGDRGILKLLTDEATRVQDALAKKLTP